MKKLSRIALIALALMLVVQSVCLADVAANVINGTWYGSFSAAMGSSAVKGTCYITCKDGVARFRAAGKTKMLTYQFSGNKLIVNGSLYGVAKTPEFSYLLDKKITKMKLTSRYLTILPVSTILYKTSAKVSKISISQPKANKPKNVYVYASGATEYVYLTTSNGTVIGSSDTRVSGRYPISYSGWKKGYNTLYAYAGLYDANGNRLVTKTAGQILDATDKAALSKAFKVKVRAK
jgi:hypothetical protein